MHVASRSNNFDLHVIGGTKAFVSEPIYTFLVHNLASNIICVIFIKM